MTSPVEGALRRIGARLDETGVGWALVGGFAVSARSEPRFTRDVDACVLVPDDAGAERLVGGLVDVGYSVGTLVEQDDVGRLATVRLMSTASGDPGIVVDLLFASSGIEPEIVAQAERLHVLPDLTVPVATVGHLVALKLLARDDLTRAQVDRLRAPAWPGQAGRRSTLACRTLRCASAQRSARCKPSSR